jgi:biopolymer transport protein ExbD
MNVGEGGGRGQDIDLNLAPIIDCFTVLITFMLASASFLAIGIFDSGVAAPGAPVPGTTPPAIQVEVQLDTKKNIDIKVSGKTKIDRHLAAKGEEYDRDAMLAEIESLKRQYPDTQMVTLSAADDVEYLHVIKTMEALKKAIPTTLLGGF